MKAVGIHVFAGGFTMGVKRVFDVECQLERHGFGKESAEQVAGVEFINSDSGEWPHVDAQFAYGNPRCTGFSCITSGYGGETHGPWAKACQDIHDLCGYAAGKYDIIVWESVQQAFSVGRPLLDYLRDEIFAPRHYRIAHIMLNAASFGNAQQRKRYFFVAYRNDRAFNIEPPDVRPDFPVLYDAIWNERDRTCRMVHLHKESEYDRDCYHIMTTDEASCVPHLPNGWGVNQLAQYKYDTLPANYKIVWDTRASDMPFSMHCLSRTSWTAPCPTLHSSCGKLIHPVHHRPLTVGELSLVMGWPDIPRGRNPLAQLAKGVVPDAGAWIARQAQLYLTDAWGDEDWQSRYDPNECVWKGERTFDRLEKFFDLTRYAGTRFDITRFEPEARALHYIHHAKRSRYADVYDL